jgi:hypothetical protein
MCIFLYKDTELCKFMCSVFSYHTQPPIQWVLGALSLGVKWSGCEADPSSTSSAKVKECVDYTSTSPIPFHGMVLS